ncbi:thiamine diphosphokinase [Desulfocastanea catecholica]
MFTLIFANGTLDHSPELAVLLEKADLIIAADGGANHCAQFAVTPDILLGDLDSIDAHILAAYEHAGTSIHRHPKQKDATDLELALDLAQEKGARTVWLVGALGGRWDMSLANVMLAAGEKYQEQHIFLLASNCSMHILHPGKEHTISGAPGQKVSVLPLKGDACGVTLHGFAYPLTDQTIPFGSSRGVSNIMRGNTATIHHTAGILLCVLFEE